MNRFDLLDNFIDDPEALIRRTRAKLKQVQAATTTSSSTS
jgi:predicted nucleic acid-binding Zn ribbon protein